MNDLHANEEALRIATAVLCVERERGRRKNFVIVFLLVLNFLSLLLHFHCNLPEQKGYDNGQGDCDSCAADTVPPPS